MQHVKINSDKTLKIRPFSIFLICILVPLNCWWVAASILRGGGSPTQVSLFYNAVVTILVLLGIGLLLRRFSRILELNRAELLVIYTCISIGAGLAGVDRFLVLMPLIGHAHWFATPENDWINLFHLHIPSWLVVSQKRALGGIRLHRKAIPLFKTYSNLTFMVKCVVIYTYLPCQV